MILVTVKFDIIFVITFEIKMKNCIFLNVH